jgi:hypothetical protein
VLLCVSGFKAGYEFVVYPSGRNPALGATYELLIKPTYPNLLRSVALRFKKYPGKSIQQNELAYGERLGVSLSDEINEELAEVAN